MKKILLITFLLSQSLFAIVSIIPVEIGENAGLHSKIGVSLETKRGNTNKDHYKGSVKITYDSNTTYITFLECSGEYGEKDHKEDTKKAYTHFRYVHTLGSKYLRTEFFAQLQRDKFKEINYRVLSGLGLRLKLKKIIDIGTGYIGVGAFYEDINYLNNQINQKSIVSNNYIAYHLTFSQKSTLAYRLDFQPVFNQLKHFILIQKLGLEIKLYKGLSLKIDVEYDINSHPAEGVSKHNFTQTTGFTYSF